MQRVEMVFTEKEIKLIIRSLKLFAGHNEGLLSNSETGSLICLRNKFALLPNTAPSVRNLLKQKRGYLKFSDSPTDMLLD